MNFFFFWILGFRTKEEEGGVCVSDACNGTTFEFPSSCKSILMQNKKNYENSNASPCKNIILKKNPLNKRNQKNPSRDYYNSSLTNLKFQQHKPKYYHLSKILI